MSLRKAVRQWRPPSGGRHRRAAALAAVLLCTLATGSYVAVARGALASTELTVEEWGGSLTDHGAYVGATYNHAVWLDISGPDEVQVISARATEHSDGLVQQDALLGRGCDGREMPLAAVAADLSRKANYEIHPLRRPRLRETDGGCWYVVLRFVPQRTGDLTVQTAEIVYRVGRATVRRTFRARITYHVVHASGRDDREEPDVR